MKANQPNSYIQSRSQAFYSLDWEMKIYVDMWSRRVSNAVYYTTYVTFLSEMCYRQSDVNLATD